MKRLLLSILLASFFLSGYCLGRRPGSVDILETLRAVYRQAAEIGRQLGGAE